MDDATFPGRYSDGRTAATRQVTVHIGYNLEILGPDLPEAESWALIGLRSATPIHWKDDEVLLRSPARPDATLYVSHPGFASALLKRAPHLSAGRQRWRYALPGLALVGALGLFVGGMYAFEWSPSKSVAQLIPHGARAALGQQMANAMARDHAACTSPAGVSALEEMVGRLSAVSGSDRPFHVRVVKWDILNAFAVSGEQIVISSTLIDEADGPDEVAGVLAHEMGHGIELHPEAGLIRSLGLSAIIELFAAGQSGTLTNAGALLLQLQYSRGAEEEADSHALRILKDADVSSKPLSDFFKKLIKQEEALGSRHGDEKPDGKAKDEPKELGALTPPDSSIFSTHPPTPERARRAADAATYAGHPTLSPAKWQALKRICDPAG